MKSRRENGDVGGEFGDGCSDGVDAFASTTLAVTAGAIVESSMRLMKLSSRPGTMSTIGPAI
jgi:hypothetical protein